MITMNAIFHTTASPEYDEDWDRGSSINNTFDNYTLGRNATDENGDAPREFAIRVIIGVVFTLMILTTIIGKPCTPNYKLVIII